MVLPPLTKDTEHIIVGMEPVVPPPPKTFKLCGKVKSALDGSPVLGAFLHVQGGYIKAMSDLQGKFCIADTPLLGSRLIARKHGWTTTDVGLKNLTKDTDGVVVLMSPKVPPAPLKFKVCGKVESAADKSPVPGATLQIQ